jgi:hypothetical protein
VAGLKGLPEQRSMSLKQARLSIKPLTKLSIVDPSGATPPQGKPTVYLTCSAIFAINRNFFSRPQPLISFSRRRRASDDPQRSV